MAVTGGYDPTFWGQKTQFITGDGAHLFFRDSLVGPWRFLVGQDPWVSQQNFGD